MSSVGNAKSLRGGTLIATPLKGADGQIYALAQGNLIVGGARRFGCRRLEGADQPPVGRPHPRRRQRSNAAVPTPLQDGPTLHAGPVNASDYSHRFARWPSAINKAKGSRHGQPRSTAAPCA